MNPAIWLHEARVANRRVRVLTEHLTELVPPGASVLDVGCGDAKLAAGLLAARPDLTLSGCDVLVREGTPIPVQWFDGRKLPFRDGAFDAVLLVDVLHHCTCPLQILSEAARVARKCVVVKDHLREGVAAGSTLRLMDWVGNARYGVALPYNYLRHSQWRRVLGDAGLSAEVWNERVGLYDWPLSMVFDRRLHFVARLVHERATSTRVPRREAVAVAVEA